MTDVESVIQSAVGIAAVGVKLSHTLYIVGHRSFSPQSNAYKIASTVSAFSLTLRLLASILQAPDGLYTNAALVSLDQILKDAGALIQDFTTLVIHARDKAELPVREPVAANGRRRRVSVVARVKYYFDQPYTLVLIAQLEYLNATLNTLLKTLDVAATSAKLTRSGKSVPEVNQELNHEKLHLETLVIAQQLSINVMQDARDDFKSQPPTQTDDSLPEIERATEQRYPKLLTQTAGAAFEPLRLCDESLDFLDPRPTIAGDDDSPSGSPTTRSEHVVDSLLQKWSNAPTETLAPEAHPEYRLHPLHDLDDESALTSGEQTPEVQPGAVDRVEQNRSGNDHSSSPSPSSQWLRPDTASAPRPVQTPQPGVSRPSPVSDVENDGIFRSVSREGLYAQSGVPYTPAPPPFPSSGESALPTRDNTLRATTAGAGRPAATRPGIPERSSSNYRRPHVSSESSSEESTDSEDDHSDPKSARRTSTSPKHSQKHSHHDSGIGDGLGIPWRIRISASKYFDFRDEKLVGPRTPYLPSEPRHWIYSHDNATTEISKKWVAEAAVIEKRYAFANLREEQSSDAVCGPEGAWRVMQPLKFKDIEAMVHRTIELFRFQSPSLASTTGPTRPPPPQSSGATVAAAAATAAAAIPLSRESQPYARGRSYQNLPPPSPSAQHRSVSFNDAVHSGSIVDGRAPRGPPGPNPHYTPYPPPSTNMGPPSPMLANPHRRGPQPPQPSDWRDQQRDSYGGPPPPRDRAVYDRDRDYPREPYPERDYYRDKERERSGGKRRHAHRERERDRDRGADKREDDRKKGKSSVPGTLAKVGGLWALLEGLDGI